MLIRKKDTELTFEELAENPLSNERVEFVVGGNNLDNIIHQDRDEEIVEIVSKMLDYDMDAANEYYPIGYKLLKEMGETKIIEELDSKEYLMWCGRE